MPRAMRRDVVAENGAAVRLEEADIAAERRLARRGVVGFAGIEARDRDHRRPAGVAAPRHDALQRHHQRRGRQHRIAVEVRHRRVAALAGDDDVELVDRRHHRARRGGDLGRRHAGNIVEREDAVERDSARGCRRRSSPWRPPCLPPPAGRSAPRCRQSAASRRGSAPRRGASSCGRHGRRHASSPATSERQGGDPVSAMGSASMSARSATRGPSPRPDDADHAGAGRCRSRSRRRRSRGAARPPSPRSGAPHRRAPAGDGTPAARRSCRAGPPRSRGGRSCPRAPCSAGFGARISPAAAPRPSLFVS